MIGHALIHIFVMPAQQRELFECRQTLGVGVAKATAARREKNDRRFGANIFNRFEERPGLHHHAGAAAVGGVVYGAVFVVCVVAQIYELIAHEFCRSSARGNGETERAVKELRKDGDDADGEH